MLITKVCSELFKHGHKVIANALYADFAVVDYVLRIVGNELITRGLAEFYVLVHGNGFDYSISSPA